MDAPFVDFSMTPGSVHGNHRAHTKGVVLSTRRVSCVLSAFSKALSKNPFKNPSQNLFLPLKHNFKQPNLLLRTFSSVRRRQTGGFPNRGVSKFSGKVPDCVADPSGIPPKTPLGETRPFSEQLSERHSRPKLDLELLISGNNSHGSS